MRALGGILTVCVLSTLSQAQEDQARDALNKGRMLFEQGAYEPARAQFAEANRLARDAPNPYRWLGLTDVKLGRCADALWELEQFLHLVKPDDKRIPEVVAARDFCKEEVKPKGSLLVDSAPSGAEVRLDDPKSPPVGATPYRNDAVTAGEHTVHLARAGFASESRTVSVQAGKETKLHLVLKLPSSAPVVAPGKTDAALSAPEVRATASSPIKSKKRYWIAGVVVGAVAVGAIAIGLGVGLSAGVTYPVRMTHDGTFQF